MSKFDSRLAENLYEDSLEGGADDDIGSVDELGWFGLFEEEKAILSEDGQGFVYLNEYGDQEALDKAWNEIIDQYNQYWKN